MRREWERNFLGYMAPRKPQFFAGLRVLDAGCGSGRHAYYAAQYGAEVWAVDLGAADVARRNTADSRRVHVVQSDIHRLPFEPRSFDFVYSLGVLHHLPDPEGAFRNLLRYLRPGGEIQIYLYGKPESFSKRVLLGAVSALRGVTTRLPLFLVNVLAYLVALAIFVVFVLPRRAGRRVGALRRLAEKLPMGAYADYPFRVCVNDQFDRFSAPVENRYRKADVEGWLRRAGLENAIVLWNEGWIGSGRLPGTQTVSAEGDESSGADVVSG
jgi:SAM-dependent methyltransferase